MTERKEVMMVSTKFLTNLIITLFGGFVVVASLTFSYVDGRSVAFAFGIAIVAIALVAQLDPTRSVVHRALDALLAATAGTMIGTSDVFVASTARWLDFALALGIVGTAIGGLTLNEVQSWRISHNMAELRPFSLAPYLRIHPAPREEATGSRAAS